MGDRDPAVEAAQRAEKKSRWWESSYQLPWDSDYAEDAAREMAAPIRELHAPEESCGNTSHTNPSATCPHCELVCGHCGLDWPCDTARLIYPESELPSVVHGEAVGCTRRG